MTISILALTAVAITASLGAGSASAATTCSWGGTPDAPTGVFTISPGITNLPAPGALKFRATGQLAGDGPCTGTMTFIGQIDAGSTCDLASFEGDVKGLPGVARFWGKGTLVVPELLYNSAGEIVGADQPEILTEPNRAHLTDCETATGFGGGTFSSTVELF